jgi:hypothetical protein
MARSGLTRKLLQRLNAHTRALPLKHGGLEALEIGRLPKTHLELMVCYNLI